MVIETEKLSEKQQTIEQLLDPRQHPEVGFQSYEMLKNNSTDKRNEFLSDEIRNPSLSYPYLENLTDMDNSIVALYGLIDQSRSMEADQEKLDVIISTLEFRIAEMEYIKLLGRLNFAVEEGLSHHDVADLADQTRELGEQLYGRPNHEIRDAALNQVWVTISSKQLSSSAKDLCNELDNGFVFDGSNVRPLDHPENSESLPDFKHPSIDWSGEIIAENTADIKALFDKWWSSKVAEHGDQYVATPVDIVEAYKEIFKYMEPTGESGVDVVLDPEVSALSWESPLMVIKVGGKRASIKTPDVLYTKFLHEGFGHGGRAVNGLKSRLPVLGTGLFTDTKRPDYLTFEEGLMTTVEEAVSHSDPQWNAVKLGHYLSISMVEQGEDFRAVFEKTWRYRLLMKLKDNQEVSSDMIDKEKKLTYTSIMRVFRGTPLNLSEKYSGIAPISFNKDLAYLNGRVLAMDYVSKLYEARDTEGLMRLFTAKFDPTIPEQDAIVERYGVRA